MARAHDYTTLFTSRILQCLEENVYICDIQGFQRIAEDSFIFKEISFLNLRKTALPTSYLFEPPITWEELTAEEKYMTQWLEKS